MSKCNAVFTNQIGTAGGPLILIAFTPERGCCGYQLDTAWLQGGGRAPSAQSCSSLSCELPCGTDDEAHMCEFSVWNSFKFSLKFLCKDPES